MTDALKQRAIHGAMDAWDLYCEAFRKECGFKGEVELSPAALGAFADRVRAEAAQPPRKLWLWKNFVDGRPEYWAFDNAYPTHGGGDPQTLGEPCGYAIFKESTVASGRKDVPESEVIAAIKRVSTRSEIERKPDPQAAIYIHHIKQANAPLFDRPASVHLAGCHWQDVIRMLGETPVSATREKLTVETFDGEEPAVPCGISWIIRHHDGIADFACAQCVPDGENLIEGFVCYYHAALALKESQ